MSLTDKLTSIFAAAVTEYKTVAADENITEEETENKQGEIIVQAVAEGIAAIFEPIQESLAKIAQGDPL